MTKLFNKEVQWSEEKNELLKKMRNISFEEVLIAIYAYVVPFIENDEAYFLKTIYPSRK